MYTWHYITPAGVLVVAYVVAEGGKDDLLCTEHAHEQCALAMDLNFVAVPVGTQGPTLLLN